MAVLYRIIDWDEIYENSVSRQRQELHWVGIPNKHDSDGYTQLVDHPNGAAHYGCWVTIVQVASKCRPRGCLLRVGGPTADRQPHDSESLARVTRLPVELFEEAIPRFLDIGWLEVVDTKEDASSDSPPTADRQPGGSQPAADRQPTSIEGREGKGKERREGKGGEAFSPDGESPPLVLNELMKQWNQIGGICSCRKLTDSRRRAFQTRAKDAEWLRDVPQALKALANSRFCQGENDRGWKADIDWFLKPDSLNRVLEGKYADSTKRAEGRNGGRIH